MTHAPHHKLSAPKDYIDHIGNSGVSEYPEWTCMLQILESLLRKTLDLERFLHTMSAVSDLIDNSLGENTWGYRSILQFRTSHGVLNQTFFEYFRMTQDDLNGIIYSKTASAVILPVLRASKFSGYSGHIEVILALNLSLLFVLLKT